MAPSNINIQNAHTGVLKGKENHALVLRCTVNSGIPKESIIWYKGSSLLGIGGPGNYGLEFVPKRSDHESICTCIVNSSALKIPLNQSITLDIKCKFNYNLESRINKFSSTCSFFYTAINC